MSQEKEILMNTEAETAETDPPPYSSIILDKPSTFDSDITSETPKTTTVVHLYVNEADRCPNCRVAFLEYDQVCSADQHAWFCCLLFACCCLSWLPYAITSCAYKQGKCKQCEYKTTETQKPRIVLLYMIGFFIAVFMIQKIIFVFCNN